MKFYCDNCNTKYGIADEKVRGKVLKVRCKKCGNVITVREQSVPVDQGAGHTTMPPKPPSGPGPAVDPRRVPWHYSINGQSFGPFAFDAIAKRFASGELGDECYVWTDSFSAWKPVREVDAFRSVLEKGQQIKPRRNTVGVSQALEAIKPEDFKRRQQQAKQQVEEAKRSQNQQPVDQAPVDRAQVDQPEDDQPVAGQPTPEQPAPEQPTPEQPVPEQPVPEQPVPEQPVPEQQADEPKPKAVPAGAAEEPDPSESKPSDDGQKDRLARLRARLQSSSDEAPAQDEELIADGGSAQLPTGQEAGHEAAAAHGPTLPMDGAPEDEEPADHSGLFGDVDAADTSAAPASSSDQPEADAEDSDRIPFLGDAPELRSDSKKVGDKKKESEGITGSLLIQLDSIQKEGRGKKTVMIVAALLIIGGLVATAFYLAGEVEPEEKVVQKDSAGAEDDDGELVQRTYSNEERSKILVLGSQRVGEDEGSDEAGDEAGAEVEEKEAPTKVAAKQDDKPAEKRVRGPQIKDDSSAMDEAFASATKKGASDKGLKKTIDDGAVSKAKLDSPLAGKSNAFKGLSALESARSDSIYNPTDSLKDREKSSTGASKLNRKQITQGMRTVRRSISVCRQRHTRRGTPLDARKIYLTITVEPTGRISAFQLDPKRIRHTEFEKCMNSHRGRWKFPSFDGEAQKMRAPFVLE